MPFKSEKQRRYMHANLPELAKRWERDYASGGVASQGGVKNYLGKQPMVSAPKYWQSSPDHPTTELAYITPAEKDLLVKQDLHGSLKGGVNRGPSGIMSLNGWGSSDPGQNRAGSSISGAMDKSSSHSGWSGASAAKHGSKHTTAMSPAQLSLLAGKKGSTTVMPGSHYGKGPTKQKSGIGGLILGAILGMINPALGMAYRGYQGIKGLGTKFGTQLGDWRENLTGYRTQDEWEEARQNRINQKRLDRLFARKDAGKTYSQKNLDSLLAQGIQPSTARNVLTGRDLNLRGQLNTSKSPMGDPMWDNQINQQVVDVMANNPDALTYAEVLANQNRAKLTGPNNMNQNFLLSGAGGNTRIQDVANVELNNAQLANINAMGASPQIMANASNRLNLARDNFTDAYRGSYIPRFSQGGLASLWPR